MPESLPQEKRTDPETPFNKLTGPQQTKNTSYTIRRKGSRYNILGPRGRLFGTYKSASVVGPRWEEMTHTPWPYRSSAYESGTRLWQLGMIAREQVGRRQLSLRPTPESVPVVSLSRIRPARKPDLPAPQDRTGIVLPTPVLALPAPRIDLQKQTRLIQALRRNPGLLFDPEVRQALRHEVEYHRPYARWAEMLLRILARYETRQHQQRPARAKSETILAKHIAWQEQRSAAVPAATGH